MLMTLTIVASHKGISILPPLCTIDVFHRLLQRNVHVSVHGLQLSYESRQRLGRHKLEGISQDLTTTTTTTSEDSHKKKKLTLVNDARVELHNDRVADDVAEEAGRVLALAL